MEISRNKFITKSMYLDYLVCAKNTWLKMHKLELKTLFKHSDFDQALMGQGRDVESLAQELFVGGILIPHISVNDAIIRTQHVIELGSKVLFQATFEANSFLVRCDVLEYDSTVGGWNLYEIKASNTLDEHSKEIDHIEDLSIQMIVLEQQGFNVIKASLLYLNKEYERRGIINVHQLFIIDDITETVRNRMQKTLVKMHDAQKTLLQSNEKKLLCPCIYRGRNAHCETFQYSYPAVPEYSVHDIARIGSSKKKLATLIDGQIFNILNIPEACELSSIQKNQVNSYQSKTLLTNELLIHEELSQLSYPLYFLDYETYPSAIPLFNGYRPYQQITFQFSVHVVMDQYSEPVHFEYLHEQQSDPSLILIQKLLEAVGAKGSVIVWNKSFETKQNNELAQLHPEYAEFLYDINNRMYDLRDIFSKQLYVHHEFRGKTSLKNVLPVLVPELSYKELIIQDGGAASRRWAEMISRNLSFIDRKKIAIELKKYCGLDTFAMYKIWFFLHERTKFKC